MCTVIILHRLRLDTPLVVGANRDEFYDRPSAGPQVLVPRPRIVGGKDLLRGGTWMGVSPESGLLVALTNQRRFEPAAPALRSRGEIVLRALEAGSVSAALRYLGTLDPREYQAFNLVVGDGTSLHAVYVHDDQLVTEEVPPGLHVLTNDRLDSEVFRPKVARARELVGPAVDAPWPTLAEALHEALGDHQRPRLETIPADEPYRELQREAMALCVHTPSYGTCSSSIVALGGRAYLHADAAPCRSPHVDVTHLLG